MGWASDPEAEASDPEAEASGPEAEASDPEAEASGLGREQAPGKGQAKKSR